MAGREPLLVSAAQLAPPPGLADLIRARARRRRRHQLLLCGSTLAAAALLLGSMLRPAGPQSLQPADAPSPGQLASPPTSSGPAPAAAPALDAGPQHTRPGGTAAQPRPQLPQGPQPTAEPAPPDRYLVRISDPSIDRPQPDGLTCTGSGGWTDGPDGWCLKFTDATNDPYAERTGLADRWRIGVWLCRRPGSGTGFVSFATPPRLRVRSLGGATVFDSTVRWAGVEPEYESSYVAGQGMRDAECKAVTVEWDTRGNDRELVPETDYRYDVDLGDPAFAEWNATTTGPSINVTYGDVH